MVTKKKPSRKEIDAMIETCIQAFRESRLLSREETVRFRGVLYKQVGYTGENTEVLKPIITTEYVGEAGGELNPSSVLESVSQLGLVRKSKHKRFIARMQTLIKVEAGLTSLRHLFSTAFAEFYREIQGKTLEERWKRLSNLGGGQNYLNL